MDHLINLGRQLAGRRNQLLYTQADLAAISGLSIMTIRAIERGKQGVSIANWVKVAEILGFELILTTKSMNDATGKYAYCEKNME